MRAQPKRAREVITNAVSAGQWAAKVVKRNPLRSALVAAILSGGVAYQTFRDRGSESLPEYTESYEGIAGITDDARTILEATLHGKQTLDDENAGVGAPKADRNVYLLALTEDPSTGDFGESVHICRLRKVKNQQGSGLTSDGNNSDCPVDLKKVRMSGGDGVSTRFMLNDPRYIVAAISTPVGSDYAQSPALGYDWTYQTYVPANQAFQTPDIIQAGRYYLKQLALEARESLSDVSSKAFPGKKVNEVIDIRLPMLLATIEHMDIVHDDIAGQNVEKVRQEFSEVLSTYALNGDNAYNYSQSNKGAYGFMQMMPNSYKGIRSQERYEENLPEDDFITAMKDHDTAMVAALLLIDDQLNTLFHYYPELRDDYLKWKSGNEAGEYFPLMVATMYNAGIDFVAKQGHSVASIRRFHQKLSPETQLYLAKLAPVWAEFRGAGIDAEHWTWRALSDGYVKKADSASQERLKEHKISPTIMRGSPSRRAVEKSIARSGVPGVDSTGFSTWQELSDAISQGTITRVRSAAGYRLDTGIGNHLSSSERRGMLYYLTPKTQEILQLIRKRYARDTDKTFEVSSMVRTRAYTRSLSKKRGNMTARDGWSSHEYGITFDITRNGLEKKEALETILLEMQKSGKILFIKESVAYHVVVRQ